MLCHQPWEEVEKADRPWRVSFILARTTVAVVTFRVHTVFESLGEMVNAFQGLETESLGKLSGSVKVCEFCGLQSAREKL